MGASSFRRFPLQGRRSSSALLGAGEGDDHLGAAVPRSAGQGKRAARRADVHLIPDGELNGRLESLETDQRLQADGLQDQRLQQVARVRPEVDRVGKAVEASRLAGSGIR